MIILLRGLQKGIETLAKLFMPLLFLLIIVLGIWSSTRSGAGEGIVWYLTPDISKINVNTFLSALSQVFFSLGIAMTAAFVFGGYATKSQNIMSDTAIVVLVDTGTAFLAGFVIFPALFSYGISPDSGPSLLFITMTNLLTEMPLGSVFGTLFFFLLLLAGLTSVVTVLEGISQSLKDRFQWTHPQSLLICFGIVSLLLIPNILSHTDSTFADIRGRSFFGWTDFLANSILLPIAGLCIVLFASFVVGFKRFQSETNEGSTLFRVTGIWQLVWKILVPISILTILIYGLA